MTTVSQSNALKIVQTAARNAVESTAKPKGATGAAPARSQIELGKDFVQQGDWGEASQYVKSQLVKSGHLQKDLATTPTFDAAASQALKAFQAENGLKVDGLAGIKTFAKLAELQAQPDAASLDRFESPSMPSVDLSGGVERSMSVAEAGATPLAEVATMATSQGNPGVNMTALAEKADRCFGDGDGQVTADELELLKNAALQELARGDVGTAEAAGNIAGYSAQLQAEQHGIEAQRGALAEAIDTSPNIGNGDGAITESEVKAYVAKQEASGDTQKMQYAQAARALLTQMRVPLKV
jgi:peptidoglycan hydrolase-like protein with peptidoglycan-binding domain